MTFDNLISIFDSYGCERIYIKELSQNDNSKNQVYLGLGFSVLNIFPIGEVVSVRKGDWTRSRFKAGADFSWIQDNGNLCRAPHSQFILYPKYPEVRFSGFLRGCENPPSVLMRSRDKGRVLFMSVTETKKIIGYVASVSSEVSKAFSQLAGQDSHGVFKILSISQIQRGTDTKKELVAKLLSIQKTGWIKGKRLDKEYKVLSCNNMNCGGYTLEAELGVRPNSLAEPDYLGWEVKQFAVKDFNKLNSSVITLMTPEPNGGFYVDKGVGDFILKYGYNDKNGIPDRMNFGGVHKYGNKHHLTDLTLIIDGYDEIQSRIVNPEGCIGLIDDKGKYAASWSFSSLLKHWNRKHNQAVYIPSITKKNSDRYYKYGNVVRMGEGTGFNYFLKEMAMGNLYYDPGIKMEKVSSEQKVKRRSQFRIKSKYIPNLYDKSHDYDL